MRIFLYLILSVILVGGFILNSCASPSTQTAAPTTPTTAVTTPTTNPAEKITINWLLGSQGIDERTWAWKTYMGGGWAGEIERLSDGKVEFNYLVGAVNPFDAYDSLVAMGGIYSSVILLNTGRWPALEIMVVPDMFTECQRPSRVAWELWQKFPVIGEQFSDTKVLAIFATTPSPPGIGFCTVDKKITTLEDMKGVKMGQYGVWGTKMTNALGFTSVAVSQTDVYESLQKGIVDGSFMDTDFLSNQNVGELVKYWCPISIMFCPFYMSMNWDTWNSLPPDIQKMMEDIAVNIPEWADYYLRQDKIRIMAEWPEIEVVDIAPEEKERWRATQDPVQQEYIDMLEKKGIEGQAIFDEMHSLFEQYKEALPEGDLPQKGG